MLSKLLILLIATSLLNSGANMGIAVLLHQFRREPQASQELAESLLALVTENGLSHFVAFGEATRGWAIAEQGQAQEGIAQIRSGIASQQALGVGVFHPYWVTLLADAHKSAGQPEEGLTALTEALALTQRYKVHFWESEIHRLKGELTLQKEFNVQGSTFKVENPQSAFPNPQLEAEECFLKAIEVAQQQHAKSLELRATVSLARLWQQQGKSTEAHTMLSTIYHWFTEGFDTVDLQEAKAVLAVLMENR